MTKRRPRRRPTRPASARPFRAHRLTDAVYGVPIYVLQGTRPQADAWMARHFQVSDERPIERDAGPARAAVYYCQSESGVCLIFLWVPPDLNVARPRDLQTLVHECMHITAFILRRRGIDLDPVENEPYAYHIGWVFYEVLSVLMLSPAARRRVDRVRKRRLA